VVKFDFIAGLTRDAGSAPFALDGGSTRDAGARTAGGRMVISPIENPPCSYLVSNGVVVGALLPAIRQDAIAGACPTPVYVFPVIENSVRRAATWIHASLLGLRFDSVTGFVEDDDRFRDGLVGLASRAGRRRWCW
jgi:hypothetical protein